MFDSLLSWLPADLIVDRVTVGPDHVFVAARVAAEAAPCPLCHRPSGRIHSRYGRRLCDLPWQGRVGELHVQVRCFRCGAPDCLRRIFAERLPAVAAPRLRRTVRLAAAQRAIALSAGGAPGARLAARLSMPVSGDTLLRLTRSVPTAASRTARVIGIDDWAWRRGQRYGTIIVDLERNRPIDLLPDRQADTVAAWLPAHPGVEIVARDRAGAYADGIRTGAPQAIQVADRWHLLRNLGDAVAGVLDRHHRDLRAAAKMASTGADHTPEPPLPAATGSPSPQEGPSILKQSVRRARFNEVMTLHAQGWSLKRIARTLALNRNTVRRWLRTGELPTWTQQSRGSSVEDHGAYLRHRWEEGCHNAVQLWHEIRARGFRGQLRTVQRWVRHLRHADLRSSTAAVPNPAWPMSSKQRAAWLVLADGAALDATEQRFVDALIASAPDLARIIGLARDLSTMVRRQQGERLTNWLAQARETALVGFADGLKRDLAAVTAALTLPWSTSPVEGQISRLKTIKRTMYGRAGFDLLRQRVLEVA